MNKGYTTPNHVKKIIRILPKKWRLMLTTLKVSKDLNNITLEEIISSLRSHEIWLEEDAAQRKGKSMDLKSKGKLEKTKALQAE